MMDDMMKEETVAEEAATEMDDILAEAEETSRGRKLLKK